MVIPCFLRLNNLVPEALTAEEITPVLYRALHQYSRQLLPEYGDDLLTVEDGLKVSLEEHRFLLINDDYLFAYEFGKEWFSTRPVIVEIFIIRVGDGKTTLREVFEAIRMLTRLYGARETQLSPRSDPALHRLYRRCGAEDVTQIMRIK